MVLAAAGCGGGGDSTAAPGGAASGGTAVSGVGGAGAQSVTDYVEYTGGKAGKADGSLPPVSIGWVNQQGGQVEIGRFATNGAELAIKYANAELGGVGGHPVELKTCFIASAEEEGTTCGQKLVADNNVSVILEGGVAIGTQSLYSTIGGAKPVIAGVAVTPVDAVRPNAAILFGDATHVLGPFGTYAKGLRQLRITDAKKIVSAPLCLNGQVRAGLGDFPIWTYAIASSLFGDTTDPGMPAYTKVTQTYGTPDAAPDPWNIVAFAQVMTTIRFLNEIGYGNITPQAVLAKAKEFKGPLALGAPQLQCGKYPDAPAVCNDQTQFFNYAGNGKFAKVAG